MKKKRFLKNTGKSLPGYPNIIPQNILPWVLARYSEDEIVRLDARHDGVERFGVRHGESRALKKHSPLRQYRRELDPVLFRSLFKFSIIRNPWDRMVSWYFSPGSGRQAWDRSTFVQLIRDKPGLEKYVTLPRLPERVAGTLGIDVRWGPLDRDMDLLLRFEHLDEDFARLCRRLDLSPTSLQRRNRSDRDHYSHYYDQETRELVAKRFRAEIRYGHYEFETPR
jgi:hypothetical protein